MLLQWKEFWISIWTHKMCLVVSGNNCYIFYCNLQATSENTAGADIGRTFFTKTYNIIFWNVNSVALFCKKQAWSKIEKLMLL